MGGRISFPIFGRSFEATGATPEEADWLATRWRFPEHDLAPHPHRIALRLIPPGPRAGGAAPVELRGAVGWRARGRAWETTGDATGIRAWHRPGGTRLVARRAEGSARELAAWHYALYVAISHGLWASGLVPVHASAIVDGEGEVTVLLGQSGTGKSTTVLQAALAGRSILAEDATWLDPGTLRIYGWDRGLRIAAETLLRFAPGLAAREWERDLRGKLIVPYESLAAPRVASGALKRVVLLERDLARPSGWEPLHARDAVRALWESTGVPLSAAERPILARCISDLVSRVELRRLRLGNTPLPL